MPDAVLAGGGQSDPRLAGDQLQELVRQLDQNAGAVAGIGLATAGAAVVQVQQHLQGLLNDGVGLPALDVDHEAHAAGLVLELRIVQALLGRRSCPLPAGRLRLLCLYCSSCCGESSLHWLPETKVG